MDLIQVINIPANPETSTRDFNLKITLLPFQILILPLDFKKAVSIDEISDFETYSDEDLRYTYKKLFFFYFFIN